MKPSTLSNILSFLFFLPSVFSSPVGRDVPLSPHTNLTIPQEDLAAPASPHFVAYWDYDTVKGQTTPPSPSSIKGFNVLILSFLLASGPADEVQEWVSMSSSQRSSIKSQYAAAGIKLMISAFGSTDQPTTDGFNPTTMATSMASFVMKYDLDGIDVDYEDFPAMNRGDGSAENWLITFTTELRKLLPSGQYLITHAPVAPWFGKANYPAGAYWKVNQKVGSMIDWYNVQFYNQGTNEYTTCANLLTTSSKTFPDTALFQLNSVQGVPLEKLVLGKPALKGTDADNGWMSASTLAGCVSQAKDKGWTAGVMVWEYPHADSAWITTVRAQSWPVGATTTTTTKKSSTTSKHSSTTTSTHSSTTSTHSSTTSKRTTTTTTTTKASTSPTGTPAGGCNGVAAWNALTAYVGGAQITFNDHVWTAKWWTQGDTPGQPTDAAGDLVWQDNGPCPNGTSSGSVAPPSAGLCTGIAAWQNTTVYLAGDQATYNSHLWTAQWWTQNNVPGVPTNPAGDLVWQDNGVCQPISTKKASIKISCHSQSSTLQWTADSTDTAASGLDAIFAACAS